MPVSSFYPIPAILDEIRFLQPHSVIDLGIGFGKYGPLVRELLDGMHGRCRPKEWQAAIEGVEIFEAYRNPCWDLYSRVTIADFRVLPVEGWDLVLMIDSLEHVEADEGDGLLRRLIRDNKQVIISVPVEPMRQGQVFGNPNEAHLRQFTGREFDKYGPKSLHRSNVLAVSISSAYQTCLAKGGL